MGGRQMLPSSGLDGPPITVSLFLIDKHVDDAYWATVLRMPIERNRRPRIFSPPKLPIVAAHCALLRAVKIAMQLVNPAPKSPQGQRTGAICQRKIFHIIGSCQRKLPSCITPRQPQMGSFCPFDFLCGNHSMTHRPPVHHDGNIV